VCVSVWQWREEGEESLKLRPNLQLVAALMEDPGGAEQHCGMRVVAAGVHLPLLFALVLPLHFLLIHRYCKKKKSSSHGNWINVWLGNASVYILCNFGSRRVESTFCLAKVKPRAPIRPASCLDKPYRLSDCTCLPPKVYIQRFNLTRRMTLRLVRMDLAQFDF